MNFAEFCKTLPQKHKVEDVRAENYSKELLESLLTHALEHMYQYRKYIEYLEKGK